MFCFFRSRTVKCLNQFLGTIFERIPPPNQELCAIVIHNNHGQGTEEGSGDAIGSSFTNRYAHVILGLHGGVLNSTLEGYQEQAEAKRWVLDVQDEIDKQGLALNGGSPSFIPPDQVDLTCFFNPFTAQRLKALKRRIDPENLFQKGSLCSYE